MRLTILFFFFSISGFSQTFEDSLQSISHLPDTAQIDSLVTWARSDAMNYNTSQGVKKAKLALQMAKGKRINSRFPNTRFYIGINFENANLLDSALKHYELGLSEVTTKREQYWKLYFYKRINNINTELGNYNKAIKKGIEGIKELESEIDSFQLAELYSDLGYSYDRSRDFYTAIKYQRIALLLNKGKNNYFKYLIMSRIAIANDDLGNYDSAHYYNQLALDYSISSKDSSDIGITKSNIGNTYLKQKNWTKAKEYLESACQINMRHGSIGIKAMSHINLGRVYLNLSRFEESNEALCKGILFSKEEFNTKYISEGYYFKSELFKNTNEYDSALYYLEKHKEIEDSLYALDKVNQIQKISAQYETEKKEQEIKIQKANLAEKESEIKAKQRTILALIILTLLVLVLAFAFYRRFQAKKNAEVQKRIIEEQEKGTKAVFAMQEEERKRISKDLHDGVGQQLAGLKINFQVIAEKLRTENPERFEELQLLKSIVSDSAVEIRNISHTMMPIALTKLGVIAAIEEMLDKSFSLTGIKYTFEHTGVKSRLAENIEISLYRIAQELVNNIIKHSKAKQVSVQLFKNANKVILVIEDDGEGISSSKNGGHGLLNMKSRVNILKGDINLEPSPNSGTLATVRIPVK